MPPTLERRGDRLIHLAVRHRPGTGSAGEAKRLEQRFFVDLDARARSFRDIGQHLLLQAA